MAKRLALITGGMGGLGETISTKMADAGYGVAVTYSPTNKTADKWIADMKSRGYDFRAYPCDVADFDSAKACVDAIVKDLGSVDILVNNAGITRDMTFRKMTKTDWDAVIHANLDSVFNMTKQVCDGMTERGWGRIINVASVNGSKGAFGQTNYAAAKSGMHGFTKSLSLEVAKKGVTVNTISPGYIGTKMVTAIPRRSSRRRSCRRSRSGGSACRRRWPGSSSTCARTRRPSSTARTSPSTAASTCSRS